MDTRILSKVAPCPDCTAPVIQCDNGVWLDVENAAEPDAPGAGRLMDMGGQVWAGFGGALDGGSAHMLHEHQPEAAR